MRKGSHNSKRMRKAAIKRRRNRHKVEDRMSELPDDILIYIISRLTLQEATSTSILSTRWRYLHTHVTHLNFPPFEPDIIFGRGMFYRSVSEIKERFPKHVKMINDVLDSHRAEAVKELKMHMYDIEGGDMKKWVEFALTREVEILDINMIDFSDAYVARGCYNLGLAKLITTCKYRCCLKELTLSSVDVDDQDFDLLISDFLALENLSIRDPGNLKNVSIVGNSKLKHLDISDAALESFEVRDLMNLVSLRCHYLPRGCALWLGNIPELIELDTNESGFNTRPHDELFAKIPSCIRDQLQLLRLSTLTSVVPWVSKSNSQFWLVLIS
ncbi:hypothetical protein C2S53_006159 [Perilla frutescens var. hirtella]|uniref:F-box domain-containing protein n=1 Tax=Perilla frutescens var. hirtella TaxID=608512 RepID=A0AAD4IUC3_PERFH|nr:hypothetical protein C2S51_008128 [Perilla frutescens var. frutescens]KAH6821328.1 hypothetical protein C2S53_006159 [Perilla frutescens var. hirtella]